MERHRSAASSRVGILGLVLVYGLSFGSAARGAGVAGPAVVELFTSEGCSSCPPAETVLGSLAGRPDVIALAWHVTYWDSAAWRDRFGMQAAVDRQTHYVRQLGLASAYTPQVVVDGRVDIVGSDAHRINQTLLRDSHPLRLTTSVGSRGIELQLPESPSLCPCTLRVISTRALADTAVGGGENSGRRLREYNIVLSSVQAGSWDGGAAVRSVARSSVSADASNMVVLAERQRDGAIIAAGSARLR
jgi:hypothetical protein